MGAVRVEVEGRVMQLSNLDKVLYPRTGMTKGEVLTYYARVAPALLTELAGRPVTRVRWPDGVAAPSFFEKNVPGGAPSWLRRVRVGSTTYPLIDDLAGLTWLVNTAALEFHVPQWRVDEAGDPLPPDRLVVDLDPGAPAGLPECCQVALLVRKKLDDLGLSVQPVASGSKGLHLYVRLPGPVPDPSGVVHQLADELQEVHPDLVLATMSKQRRAGKVFVDWSQNNPSKTTVAPWSLRGRDRPTAAVPLSWGEVEAGSEDPLAIEQISWEAALSRLGDGLPSS